MLTLEKPGMRPREVGCVGRVRRCGAKGMLERVRRQEMAAVPEAAAWMTRAAAELRSVMEGLHRLGLDEAIFPLRVTCKDMIFRYREIEQCLADLVQLYPMPVEEPVKETVASDDLALGEGAPMGDAGPVNEPASAGEPVFREGGLPSRPLRCSAEVVCAVDATCATGSEAHPTKRTESCCGLAAVEIDAGLRVGEGGGGECVLPLSGVSGCETADDEWREVSLGGDPQDAICGPDAACVECAGNELPGSESLGGEIGASVDVAIEIAESASGNGVEPEMAEEGGGRRRAWTRRLMIGLAAAVVLAVVVALGMGLAAALGLGGVCLCAR